MIDYDSWTHIYLKNFIMTLIYNLYLIYMCSDS